MHPRRRNPRRARWLIALAVWAGACSAPATLGELSQAESYERAGNYPAAIASYRAAQNTCRRIEDHRRRELSCSDAYHGEAQVLVSADRLRDAASAYTRIPSALPNDRAASARATLRAGELYLQLDQPGDDRRAYELLWRVVTDYPEQAFAADAMEVLLRDGRVRAPQALYRELEALLEPMSQTLIADNILYALADLERKTFDRPAAALAHLDRLARDYPDSGLSDDSLWYGAQISRALGDSAGAVARLRTLVATREVAFGTGSYFSVWLDNAQLEIGRILRDDLGDYEGALLAFRKVAEDYPDSILLDDAVFERAQTHQRMGDANRACRLLAALRQRWPDSKYELERAPRMREALGCEL